MNTKRYIVFTSAVVATSILLSGCQSLTGYKKIENVESAKVWAEQIIPLTGEVNIACAGTYHCEITQIDKTLVIATDTHRPVNPDAVVFMTNANGIPYAKLTKREQVQIDTAPLADNKSVKIVPLSASGMPGLINYYARVKPIKREVHVNFYPENNLDYIERFAMIDEFKQPGTYLLQAYQKKSAQGNGSLLDNASPAPLCVDLLKDGKLQRRFCKQMTSERQGEFVEAGTLNKAKNK